MRQVGQILVFLGVLTGLNGIGIRLASPGIMGVVAIALPLALILAGILLVRRSEPTQ